MSNRPTNSYLIVYLLIIVLIAILLGSCSSSQPDNRQIELSTSEIVFGLVTAIGGFGDRSYNDLLFNGLVALKAKHNIDFVVRELHQETEGLHLVQELIHQGANYLFAAGGYYMVEPIDQLARKHPEVFFIILNSDPIEYLPNVASISFNKNDGSFLVGALAALETQTNVIAMIGGQEHPSQKEFFLGFQAGAKYINPQIKIFEKYVSYYESDLHPFLNPTIAYEIASNLYNYEQVDLIFAVALASNLGVFNAARNYRQRAIGCGADQDHLIPGSILTSLIIRMDNVIIKILDEIIQQRITNKKYVFGLDGEWIQLSPMHYSKINPGHLEVVESLKKRIIEKKIIVPNLEEK